MANIKAIISQHNKRIIKNKSLAETRKTCNCRKNNTCPMEGNCLASDVIYKATVKTPNNTASYIGLASGPFKMRYNNHIKSFRHERYEKETELSKYIWNLKRKSEQYSINWSIVKTSNTAPRRSGLCNLCLEEKVLILEQRNEIKSQQINKRDELVSTCRHIGIKPTRGRRKTQPT